MAVRELRRSGRHLALYGACMALGIAALVALSGLREATRPSASGRAR
jgi:predicted lysophospholipase L1 biosynthesis ABC-type transport system permease subunit